ncbi:class I SAM-dependent methyltransferase [Anaerosporobacter faecicola]|uniref:class I SAM-dependent methyltransferase n=1 Tax=Anaerosporobacter faecicola TaxID=2718714 RepID=UPI0014399739|nr:class I SAM-dependent methyltransferase [Anaerosporobacter faecicola]
MAIYMGNENWWDDRFSGREKRLGKPEEKLVAWENRLLPGPVLDVACGQGRNAIYLASLGYSVTALDFSRVAITHLRELAKEAGVTIATVQGDCQCRDTFVPLGMFQTIVVNHYRLTQEIVGELLSHLTPDGLLWINGFCRCPETNPNITTRDLLNVEDYMQYKERGYDVLTEQYETDLGEFVCIVIKAQ